MSPPLRRIERGYGSRHSLTSGRGAARLRSALAALVLALAALTSAPAAAVDFTISASGNCAGTPANCGTSSNRNGDRDTTWPGLQVDEGDQITFTVQANNVPSGSNGLWSLNATISGSAWTTNDLTVQVGQSILGSPQTITLAKVLPETSERYRY